MNDQALSMRRVFQVFEGIDILLLVTEGQQWDTQPHEYSPTYSEPAGATHLKCYLQPFSQVTRTFMTGQMPSEIVTAIS